ncbi:arginine--tRNA ligase [Candidatus Bathyarchaeota archaeon]|nr:arginine--tRNA ligase [Candidatus Bathyarchaeota archaeon]
MMKMNPLATLREECTALLKEALEEAFPEAELPEIKYTEPPDPELGAISTPVCFQLARSLRQAPAAIAETLVNSMITADSRLISNSEALNGYINFHTDTEEYSRFIIETILEEDTEYGLSKSEEPQKVMVEHTSANPNSPLHIGNARNSILGDSLARLLENHGHEVVVHFLVNDMGRQVAMATYGWRLLGKPVPEDPAELWVGTIYASVNVITEINRLELELKEAEENEWIYEAQEARDQLTEYRKAAEQLKERYPGIYENLWKILPTLEDPQSEIVQLNTAYENNESEAVKDVRQVVRYCLDGFEKSLGYLGIEFDSFDYESDLVWREAAEEVLDDLQDSGYVIEERGALILDCDRIAEDFDLKDRWGLHPEHEIPRLVLVRSDGTTLYTLRDIAYSIWKFREVDRVINVIGQEQTLAQLQLRIALAAIDKAWMGDNQLHYSYEFVKLPGVKMSGRLGRYVTLNEVLEKAVELAYEEVDIRNQELEEDEKQAISKMVGYGAVKYTLLSVEPMKQVVFDWKEALNFETNSAPFIQYSHARICSIIRKAREKYEPDYGELVDVKEKELINLLVQFPETFLRATDLLKPGDITAYANNLANKFNSFYATQRVIGAESKGVEGARLKLIESVRVTLRNALNLLGIEAPEKM